MLRGNKELWLAFLAMIAITGVYGLVVVLTREIPPASELFGHGMGIVGFVFMLMTETLYGLRKRSRSVRWGRMSSWLQFHIFTGLVGPYMVLLHTSWKFNGLAGATTLLTVIIVISGFVGRYIFTRIPRTMDGLEIGRFRRRRSSRRGGYWRSGIRSTFPSVWRCSSPRSFTSARRCITRPF